MVPKSQVVFFFANTITLNLKLELLHTICDPIRNGRESETKIGKTLQIKIVDKLLKVNHSISDTGSTQQDGLKTVHIETRQ